MSHDNEGNGISFHLVKLDSSSPEYQKVMDRILETLHSVDIVSIERVQNYYLYQAYQLLKQKMESDRGESNERQLFHGTTPDNTKKINYSGFDWRFSGFAHGKHSFLTRNWLAQMTTTNRIISSQALIIIRFQWRVVTTVSLYRLADSPDKRIARQKDDNKITSFSLRFC